MSDITYHLSNHQRREILVRGTELRIALPAPPKMPGGAKEWAKSVLESDIAGLVTVAEETELWVNPNSLVDGLTGLIGEITEPSPTAFVICVVAIVVTLTPTNKRRQSTKPRWPVSVEFFGKQLP